MLPLILGLLAGAAKSIGDAQGNASDKKLQAETSRWSPWTQMKAPEPRKAHTLGTMLGGLSAGLQLGTENPNFDKTVLGGIGDVGNAIGGGINSAGKALGIWGGLPKTGIAPVTDEAKAAAGGSADLGIDEGGVNAGLANFPSSSWQKILQMQNRKPYGEVS